MSRVRVLLAVTIDQVRYDQRHGPRPMTVDQDVRDLVADELRHGVSAAERVITDVRLEPLRIGQRQIA